MRKWLGWMSVKCHLVVIPPTVNDCTSGLLLKKMKEAWKECTIHWAALTELEFSIPNKCLAVWQAEVVAWEADWSWPNPYEAWVEGNMMICVSPHISSLLSISTYNLQSRPSTCPSQGSRTTRGNGIALHSDMSVTQLILLGLFRLGGIPVHVYWKNCCVHSDTLSDDWNFQVGVWCNWQSESKGSRTCFKGKLVIGALSSCCICLASHSYRLAMMNKMMSQKLGSDYPHIQRGTPVDQRLYQYEFKLHYA